MKKNKWRDLSLGVVNDIGPHLFDLLDYWFQNKGNINFLSKSKFENKSYDHSILTAKDGNKKFILEMTYCMWKNTFNLEIIGSKGSISLDCLCKWGASKLSLRKRVLPSGKPIEYNKIIKMKDPTWNKEHKFFFNQIKKKANTDFYKDIKIYKTLKSLSIK